jgi:beta-aspartyl-dipeptidase (metallo-type)
MLLIDGAEIFAPAPLGRRTLFIANDRIAAVGADAAGLARAGVELEVIDGAGCFVMPGLVDPHAHLIGGSGEEGFASQTPEITASELLRAGITTVVGTLGTDTTTRTMPALLAKVKALRAEGLSAYAWTGGYDARPLTGSVRDDIVLIEEIIGAGEVAIADPRSSQHTAAEVARLAADCYVAGTLTAKAGLLHLHTGPSPAGLAILRDVLVQFDVKPASLYPTHVQRSEALMLEAIDLTRRGTPIDLDVYDEDLPHWLRFYREHGGDPALITASSDAAINAPGTLFEQLMDCVRQGVASLEEIIAIATANPARTVKAPSGVLAPGRAGHLLLVDSSSYELRTVICGGRVVMRDGRMQMREQFLVQSNRTISLHGGKASS